MNTVVVLVLALLLVTTWFISTLPMWQTFAATTWEKPEAKTSSTMRSILRICRSKSVNSNAEQVKAYTCAGPEYENFTDRLLEYVLEQNRSSWGRRQYPLPAGVSVFIIGNSHTRQVYNALNCQHENEIVSVRYYADYQGRTKDMPVRWRYKNNASLVAVSNTPLIYHKDKWVKTLEEMLDQPLSSFDAIVMGRINGFETRSNFGKQLLNYSLQNPEFFDPNFSVPTIEGLARVYNGTIIAVPMFAAYGQDVKEHAERAANLWRKQTNRSNIHIVNARAHIEAIGHECGSDTTSEVGKCLHSIEDNNGGRNPRDMHRCTGSKGGHSDLVAWDVIEKLHEVLPEVYESPSGVPSHYLSIP